MIEQTPHPFERYLGQLTPGMGVYDCDAHKLGSLVHVYRDENAELDPHSAPAYEEVMEVKTGFLGLGEHVYIPLSAIHEVKEDKVLLSESKEAIQHQHPDWHRQPDYLRHLR